MNEQQRKAFAQYIYERIMNGQVKYDIVVKKNPRGLKITEEVTQEEMNLILSKVEE